MKLFGNRTIPDLLHDYRKNDFAKKLTTVLGLDILVKASGFILIPIYLRVMNQEEYGSYNYLVSLVQTIGLVLTLGLYIPQIKLYHSIQEKREKGKLLFTIMVALAGCVVLLLLPLYAFNGDRYLAAHLFRNFEIYERYRLLLLLALVVTMAGLILTYFLFASERIKQIKAYNGWRMVLICITVAALFLFRKDPVGLRLLLTYCSELLLICIFAVYYLRETVPVFSRKLLYKCLSMGLPIMFTTVFGIVANFSDKFFLEKYRSLNDLSGYYLAFSFASIIPLISASLQNVWMPAFMKETNLQRNNAKTKKLLTRLVLFFIFMAIAIWVLFHFLLWVKAIPAKYAGVSLILPILSAAQILLAVTTVWNNYLIYFEKTYLLLISGLFVSLASVGLSVLLVPGYGIYGAAYAALISNGLYLGINYYLVQLYKKRFGREEAVVAAPDGQPVHEG